jgi:heme/copper-type cytochrome/quinol oxidase subunit 1
MLVAKLFALLAVLLLGLGAFERTRHQHSDIYYHGTYFVISRISVRILQAIVCACFGLIYFTAARWLLYPLNSSLGLAQFLLVTIGLVLMSLAMKALKAAAWRAGLPKPIPNVWPSLALRGAAASLLLGCGVFVVNLTWTAFQLLRPR